MTPYPSPESNSEMWHRVSLKAAAREVPCIVGRGGSCYPTIRAKVTELPDQSPGITPLWRVVVPRWTTRAG